MQFFVTFTISYLVSICFVDLISNHQFIRMVIRNRLWQKAKNYEYTSDCELMDGGHRRLHLDSPDYVIFAEWAMHPGISPFMISSDRHPHLRFLRSFSMITPITSLLTRRIINTYFPIIDRHRKMEEL